MTEPIEKLVEVDGFQYLVLKRQGVPGVGDSLYSFDRGETWDTMMFQAFAKAHEAGKLVKVGADPRDGQGGLEAFMVSLMGILKDMEEGETIKLTKGPTAIVVLREVMGLAVRTSDLDDVDFRLEPGS